MEGLAQLTHLSKNSHQEFLVKCSLHISKKCRLSYKIEFRRLLKVMTENNNKIVCLFCSRTSKFSGRNNPNTKYNIDDNYFSNIDSSLKAYLLGWIASDGHIGKRGFKISIHQKDIQILKLFSTSICEEVLIVKFNTPTSKMCSYEINSQKISIDLCKLLQIDPGPKSSSVSFPAIDDIYKWDFIRGYFDGDGSVNDPDKSKYPYIKGNIRSNSVNMLSEIKRISKSGCVSSNMFCLSNKQMIKFLDSLYSNDGPRLERKYTRYMKWKIKTGGFGSTDEGSKI